MKRLIVFLFVFSLFSFTIDDQKGGDALVVPSSSIVACTSSPIATTNENLGEQVNMFFASLFETQWWPARWQCGVWSPFHGWLYIASDLAIACSYFLIPIILLYFIYQRKQQQALRFVVLLFILFILACGLTHVLDASMFWWPAYRLNALTRFVTAAISMGTVVALVKVAPQLMQLKSPQLLENMVKERTEQLNKSIHLISAYQRALDESCIVAITDHQGIIKHVNDNFCNISKYSKEELIGKDHRIINSEHHSKEFIGKLWKTIAAGKIWKGELRNRAKDGTIYWVDTTIVPFLNEHGKPYQYVAIRADITARKLAEEDLRKSLKETLDYKHALDTSAIVAITNQQGIIHHVNDNFCKISKYKAHELIGQDHRIINSEYHPKEFIRDLWMTIAQGKIWKGELKNKAKDGTTYWVDTTIVPFLNDQNKPYQYVAIRADITERKRAEENLQISLREISNYKYALDRSSIIAITDQHGIIRHVNDNFCSISKYSKEELIGKDHRIINSGYHSKDFIGDLWKTIAAGQIWKGELRNKAKDGTIYWVDTTIVPFLNEQAKPYQYIAIRSDITERKKAEEEIRQLYTGLDQKVLERTNELLQAKNQLSQTLDKVSFLASIADNIQDPVITADNEYNITRWNYPAEKLLEWKSEEVLGKNAVEILDITYGTQTLNEIRDVLMENDFWQGEVIYHTKSGRAVNVMATASKLKNEQGNLVGSIVLIRDISERIKAEGKLKEFEHFFNNTNDLCGIANGAGYFENINTNFGKVLGYSEKEFCKTPFIELVHPDDVADTRQEYEKLKAGELTINFINRYRRNNGSYIYLDWNATPNLLTGKLYCVARDITDRKKVEMALKESEEQIQTIFRNAPDAVVVIDEDGKIVRWNPRAETIFGWSAAEVSGKHLHDTIIPEQFREAHVKGMKHFLKTGEGPILNKQIELHALRKDNTTFDAGISISPTLVKGKHVFIGFISDITERKRAEEALSKLNTELERRVKERTEDILKNEKRFRGLIENNNDIIRLSDENFKPIYRSPNLERITGWKNEDIEEDGDFMLVHPEDRGKMISFLNETKANPEKIIPFNYRFRHKDGHFIWVEGTVTNMLHDESINGIITNFRDITERKKTEEKLASERALLRTLIDNLPDYIYVKDLHSRHLINNKANVDLLGALNEKETLGKSMNDFFGAEAARSYIENDQLVFQSGNAILNQEESFVSPTGDKRYLLTTKVPIHDDDQAVIGLVGISRDITWQKIAEEKIRRSEKIYRTIASSIPGSVICLFDHDFRYLLIEGDMLEKAGYSKSKLLGNKAIDVLPPERFTYVKAAYDRVFKGETFSVETNREGYDFITHFVPIKNDNNEVYLAMSVGIDITELKKAHRAISELNIGLEQKIENRTAQLEVANKELESFSYSVSHDLRAPLRAVNGYAKMLEEDYHNVLDENGKRMIGIVRDNAKQMGQLIDDLLAFSRLGRKEVHKEEVNMNRLVQSTIEEMNIDQPIIEFKIENLHVVWGDATLLKQVLYNYISNAVKYSSKTERPRIEIKSAVVNNDVIYSVADNGSGFDMNYVHKLFQVFQRLHSQEEFEGTGVGLAIVSRIITKHGGKVWAESKVGEGATFYFSLPNTSLILQNLN